MSVAPLARPAARTFNLPFVLGVAAYARDWLNVFSASPFFDEWYYHYYVIGFIGMLIGAVIVGWRSLTRSAPELWATWAVLVLPSFVLRHLAALFGPGDLNLWPPVLLLDLLVTGLVFPFVWIGSLVGERFRSRDK